MVFKNPDWNNTGDIVVYSNYHKYWLDREKKQKNPLFDVFSGRILDLKEGKPEAIRYFYDILDREICDDVAICVVPSSNSENLDSGIAKLGKMLAENKRKDRVYYLYRAYSIMKLASGGRRSIKTHLDSIDVREGMSVEKEIVLLMDDVTTTGNSLYACRSILLEHGVENVEMFALGKAV